MVRTDKFFILHNFWRNVRNILCLLIMISYLRTSYDHADTAALRSFYVWYGIGGGN